MSWLQTHSIWYSQREVLGNGEHGSQELRQNILMWESGCPEPLWRATGYQYRWPRSISHTRGPSKCPPLIQGQSTGTQRALAPGHWAWPCHCSGVYRVHSYYKWHLKAVSVKWQRDNTQVCEFSKQETANDRLFSFCPWIAGWVGAPLTSSFGLVPTA